MTLSQGGIFGVHMADMGGIHSPTIGARIRGIAPNPDPIGDSAPIPTKGLCGCRWMHNDRPDPTGQPTPTIGYRIVRGSSVSDIFPNESGKIRRQAFYVNRRSGRIIGPVPSEPTTTDDDSSLLDSIPDNTDPTIGIHTVQPIRGKDIPVYPFDDADMDSLIVAFGHNAARIIARSVSRNLQLSGILANRHTDTGYADCLSFVRTTLSVEFGPFGGHPLVSDRLLRVKCRSLVADWQRREIHQRRGGRPYARFVNQPDGTVKRYRAESNTNVLRTEYRGFSTLADQSARIARINQSGEWIERNIERFYARVYDRLNDRERDILGLYLRGSSAKDIGASLDTTPAIVRTTLARIVVKARTLMPEAD